MTDMFRKRGLRALAAAALAAGLALASAATLKGEPRSRITPYLEVQQVLSADLNGGDVLTYTSVGAGVDAFVSSQRVKATISYNYQRRIAWNDNLSDNDIHTGLAAAQLTVVPNLLTFDAGALAARSHGDLSVPVPGFQTADDPNLVEIYSVYAGPTLSTKVGAVDVGASYRLGYVHVDDHGLAGVSQVPGQPRFDRYDGSVIHSAAASVGMGPGELPVGWTVGAGYSREDNDILDATNEAVFVRGDIVVPVTYSLALTGGAGYEKLKASQQDILRDTNGFPIVGPNGELVADPSRPRLLAYDQSGLIWDVGVIWRPSRRTELQARVGRRYGGTTFVGSLEHRINESYAITASVYDQVTSFGRLLISDLNGLPVDFKIGRNRLSGGGGCVFGNDPGSGTCFDDALQSINNSSFRYRGAAILFSGGRGPWSFGAGLGYARRNYFGAGDNAIPFNLANVTDESVTFQANAERQLSRNSSVALDSYLGWFDSGAAGVRSSRSAGLTGSYYHTLMDGHLEATAQAGIYTVDAGQYDSSVASILFGLRYAF
ncbi:porin family protein [Sphingosinicella rhizophila]|uniref:Preprotein translocase subunit YajC n=1 Tax=Sphingosinicella rhizophila TaxID=3050082 RepID=A0ABU3Q2Y2_9SPHN|nr:hypothetical protein [Sphingosinicella sp. GR2756]MDT9597758.1 hypothetical protein [Sphingosinicella sp. GR2756]